MQQRHVTNRDRCPIGLRVCTLCYWRKVSRCTFPVEGYDRYGKPRIEYTIERDHVDNLGKNERRPRQETRALKEKPQQSLPKNKQHGVTSGHMSERR